MTRIRGLLLSLLLTAIAAPAWADHVVYNIYVDGLECPLCAYGIEKNLLAIEGLAGEVRKLTIDADRGVMSIEIGEGQPLDEAEVARAVEEAGFRMRRFEIEPHGG